MDQHGFSASEWAFIITTTIASVSAAVCSIINVVRGKEVSLLSKVNHEVLNNLTNKATDLDVKTEKLHLKTDNIENNTNGNISELRAAIRQERYSKEHLFNVLVTLTDKLPPNTLREAGYDLEKLRSEIFERKAFGRRVSDGLAIPKKES